MPHATAQFDHDLRKSALWAKVLSRDVDLPPSEQLGVKVMALSLLERGESKKRKLADFKMDTGYR